MLTQTAEYALRALVFLAHDPDDGYHQTRDMAKVLKVPGNYLGKILQNLARARIVESQRGMHGGFRIAKLPEQVRLFDVLEALDSLPKTPDCPLMMNNGQQLELCGLHRRFASMTRLYTQFLMNTTLGDVLQPESIPAQCPGPERIPEYEREVYPCPNRRNDSRQLTVLSL